MLSEFSVKTDKQGIINITEKVQEAVNKSKNRSGIAVVFTKHTTCAVTIAEHEPGLQKDIPRTLDTLVPAGNYGHDKTRSEKNAPAHIKSAIISPSLTVPFENRKLLLGTWQSIVLAEFDVPRTRTVLVKVVGD